MPRRTRSPRSPHLPNPRESATTQGNKVTPYECGHVIFVRFESSVGAEIHTHGKPGGRPCVVLSESMGRIRVVAVRSMSGYRWLPTQVPLKQSELGLGGKDCFVDCEQVHTVDSSRVNLSKGIWARLDANKMVQVQNGIREVLALY